MSLVEDNRYNPAQDYCEDAKRFQAVPSSEQYAVQHPNVKLEDYNTNRSQTLYSCPDNYHMGTIQDDHIYIATTDKQHDQIVAHQTNPDQKLSEKNGPSGYFSDQATIDTCKNKNTLDNTKYNEACQIAPRRDGGITGKGDATYKPHVDCFEVDRNKMQEIYGMQNFNAAISKCEANNQFGSGGGNQGYNPHVTEMINNGCLRYSEGKSYSDTSISKSEHNNPNTLTNSVVGENDYKDMMNDAKCRSTDCIKNNTPHPSPEACNNGFPKDNAIKLNSDTGHAVPVNNHTNSNSSTINSQTVAATTGGGANAPNNTSRVSKDIPNSTTTIRGQKPSQNENPSSENTPSTRGQKPTPVETTSHNNGAERGGKPTEAPINAQNDPSTVRGEKPQESPKNTSAESQTQRGTPPGSTGSSDSKASSSSSSGSTSKASTTSNATDVADKASKAPSEPTSQTSAPKTDGMGM